MMIVQHVVLVLMNVLLRQSQKVIFTKLILNFVPIVKHVLMFARLKQSILKSKSCVNQQCTKAHGIPRAFFTYYGHADYNLNLPKSVDNHRYPLNQ